MIGSFIHVVCVSMLLGMSRAVPGQRPTPTIPPRSTECTSVPLPSCAALDGTCMNLNDTCVGTEVINELFCKFTDTCKCCIPVIPDPPQLKCTSVPLPSCAALDGTCMNLNDTCVGWEVINELFCKFTDTCKCCIPVIPDPPQLMCPGDMEDIGGCCYSFSSGQKTWDDANTVCKDMGTMLNMNIRLAEVGTIPSCNSTKFMEAVVEHGNDVWLGACETDTCPGFWQWKRTNQTLETTGNPLWYHHEPKAGGGRCLEAAIYNNPRGEFANFKNAKCSVSKHFVCQLF